VSLHVGYFDAMSIVLLILGEILEKATRVLTDEDKALLDKDFVGKNGQRRKLEVSVTPYSYPYFPIKHNAYSLSWVVKN
jgi:hypothetical protein